MMKIDNEYRLEQTVYLLTDPEQNERVITCIMVLPGNVIYYSVVCGTEESTHYSFELSDSKRVF